MSLTALSSEKFYSVFGSIIYIFHLTYLHIFNLDLQKHAKGAQSWELFFSLFDDVNVNSMLFKYSVSFPFFPVIYMMTKRTLNRGSYWCEKFRQ